MKGYVRYTNDEKTNDAMDIIITMLQEVEERGFAKCRLCDYHVVGDDIGDVLQRLGEHGEEAHDM